MFLKIKKKTAILIIFILSCILGGLLLSIYFKENTSNNESTITITNATLSDSQKKVYYNWRNNYLKEQNNEMFVNSSDNDTENYTALSESQGYGMIITVLSGESKVPSAKEDFKKLYYYYKNHLDSNTNLMSWKQDISNGTSINYNNNATDGDLYIAYSLIKAYELWNVKEYKTQAENILNDILKYNYNSNYNILTVGNWVTVDSTSYNMFRSSDVIPMFFEKFYDFTNNKTWETINNSMLSYLNQESLKYKSGLVSDFIMVDSNGARLLTDSEKINSTDNQYSWNALRVPMQLSFGKLNNISNQILYRMNTFFNKQQTIFAGYELDGTPTVNYSSLAFTKMITYSLDKTNTSKNFNDTFTEQDTTKGNNYYGETLYTISKLL